MLGRLADSGQGLVVGPVEMRLIARVAEADISHRSAPVDQLFIEPRGFAEVHIGAADFWFHAPAMGEWAGFEQRQSRRDHRIGTEFVAHPHEAFAQEAGAVRVAAAVLAGALMGAEQLSEEVAVHDFKIHPVEAGLHRQFGGAQEVFLHGIELVVGDVVLFGTVGRTVERRNTLGDDRRRGPVGARPAT